MLCEMTLPPPPLTSILATTHTSTAARLRPLVCVSVSFLGPRPTRGNASFIAGKVVVTAPQCPAVRACFFCS